MKYIAAVIVTIVLLWPFLIWIYDGTFTPVVWQSFTLIWGLALVAVIITKIQGKKLW